MSTPGDNPIRTGRDDTLGRVPVAVDFAAELRTLDVSEGSVVAIMGPWGSGKTSLVNLVKEELGREPGLVVLDFNPWMFSGTEQLVESFFVELAAQLKIKPGKLGKIAGEVEAYGDLLSPLSLIPFVGSWFSRLSSTGAAVKKFHDRRKESVGARRAKLAAALSELEQPIVVVVDDIDRLNTTEIRDIFRLVRLTASFPQVTYLLAFDRSRVEQALGDSGVDGRSYLEKIVQVTLDIPTIPDSVLMSQFTRQLATTLEHLPIPQHFHAGTWPDILAETIWPLITTMRDVRRYVQSIRAVLRTLSDQVALADMLALEAVRIFLPDTLAALARARNELTELSTPTFGASQSQDPAAQARVEAMINSAPDHPNVCRAIIERLFPAGLRYLTNTRYGPDWGQQWLRQRRVAHADVLSLYLERATNEGFRAFTDAERAFNLMGDEAALDSFLRSLDPSRTEDVIAALENYEHEFPPEVAGPGIVVLLNLLPNLPEREGQSLFLIDTRLVVRRVVLRLLRRLGDPANVEPVVADLLPRINTLSSRWDLVTTVGHREGMGHRLVSETAAAAFENQILDAITAAQPAQLAHERELLRLLTSRQHWQPESEPRPLPTDNVDLNTAVLLAARSYVRSQAIGQRAVNHTLHLHWDVLVSVYGDQAQLVQAIDSVRDLTRDHKQLKETITLADRYLTGWRPPDFPGDDND